MKFDLSFVDLELESAKTGEITKELLEHEAFAAIVRHDEALQRPAWGGEGFRACFAEAKAGNTENYADWGLAPLFQEREKIESLKEQIEKGSEELSKRIDTWIEKYTTVPQQEDVCCICYVGSYDGGFAMETGDGKIYLNLAFSPCQEAFLQTLVHESYHGRQISAEARQHHDKLENGENPISAMMFYTAEEGVASFVGFGGSMTTEYPVLPMNTPKEGCEELKDILNRYARGEISGEEALGEFMQTYCCYTAGSYIANSVWEKLGKEGLDLWSDKADLQAYYKAFCSTLQGADWPELKL